MFATAHWSGEPGVLWYIRKDISLQYAVLTFSVTLSKRCTLLFLSYDRNTGSCICLSLHLLMYFIIISHKNHCTGMSSQVTECGCAVILSNGL